MLSQTLLGEKEGAAGGVREDCVNKREGKKQQMRKHSGVQNETARIWKGRKGWKEGAVSQRAIMVMLGHNTSSPGVRGLMTKVFTDLSLSWGTKMTLEHRERMDWASEEQVNSACATVTHFSNPQTAYDHQYTIFLQ